MGWCVGIYHAKVVLSHAFWEALGQVGGTHAAWPRVGLRAPVSGPSGSFLVQLLELSFKDTLDVGEREGADSRAPGPTNLPEDSGSRESTQYGFLPFTIPALQPLAPESSVGSQQARRAGDRPSAGGFPGSGLRPGWKPITGSETRLFLMRINWGIGPGVAPACLAQAVSTGRVVEPAAGWIHTEPSLVPRFLSSENEPQLC